MTNLSSWVEEFYMYAARDRLGHAVSRHCFTSAHPYPQDAGFVFYKKAHSLAT